MSVTIHHGRIETPAGRVEFLHRDGTLVEMGFERPGARRLERLAKRFGRIDVVEEKRPSAVSRAMRAYLKGDVHAIDSLPVQGDGTPFQECVWAALRKIPAGRTMSYAAVAAKIGHPTAIRAVARANALNPVGIVVPCHRVIGSNGKLTGYAGGLNRKAWLLEHERKHAGLEESAGASPDLFAGLV